MFLKTENLTKKYTVKNNIIYAIKNINLEIKRGDLIAIVGPSGSGKTTLLNLIGLLDVPTSGEIIFNDIAISKKTKREILEIRRRRIGYIFQSFNLLPTMTALQNVEFPMYFVEKDKNKIRKRALALLKLVKLENRCHHLPIELSMGEQQRVAIARALINDPELILADEPTGNLDSVSGENIINLMANLNKVSKKTFLIVTHDENIARKTHRIIKLKDGEVIA
ncbi:MAG: ABC transporter ATP-binding protein [Promethearchaeia archaeon]